MASVNPKTIMESYVTAVRAMPALVTLVGGTTGNITALHAVINNATDILQAVNKLETPRAMFIFEGARPVQASGGREVLSNSFRLILKLKLQSDYMDFWTEFINGTPTTGSTKLTDLKVTNCLDFMRDYSIARQSIPVTETTSVDFFSIGFAVRQSGC